jgi:hypothetical protein
MTNDYEQLIRTNYHAINTTVCEGTILAQLRMIYSNLAVYEVQTKDIKSSKANMPDAKMLHNSYPIFRKLPNQHPTQLFFISYCSNISELKFICYYCAFQKLFWY